MFEVHRPSGGTFVLVVDMWLCLCVLEDVFRVELSSVPRTAACIPLFFFFLFLSCLLLF